MALYWSTHFIPPFEPLYWSTEFGVLQGGSTPLTSSTFYNDLRDSTLPPKTPILQFS